MLVNYVDENKIDLTKHLACVNLVSKILLLYSLPWSNLMSVLLDSCHVMRGKKAGLEVKLSLRTFLTLICMWNNWLQIYTTTVNGHQI